MATLKFDELNVLWFNKMELPTAEKLLRIEMAAVFERELNKIFSSQRERADSDKYLLYATVYATIMSSTYIEITNNYFLKYVLNIASNVKGLSTRNSLQRKFSRQLKGLLKAGIMTTHFR